MNIPVRYLSKRGNTERNSELYFEGFLLQYFNVGVLDVHQTKETSAMDDSIWCVDP